MYSFFYILSALTAYKYFIVACSEMNLRPICNEVVLCPRYDEAILLLALYLKYKWKDENFQLIFQVAVNII